MFAENAEMNELKTQKENMERISKKIADEVLTLKAQCDREKENARIVKMEADRVSNYFIILVCHYRKTQTIINRLFDLKYVDKF